MSGGTEVADGVHRLGDSYVNWWLVREGDAAVLVDAGLPGHYSQLGALLDRLGLGVGAVKAVVVTHGHIDHLGTIEAIRTEAGVGVYVPSGDRDLAASRPKISAGALLHAWRPSSVLAALDYARNGVTRSNPVVDATSLDDGEVLDLPGRLRFVEAPGHTPGGGIFVMEERGVVFSGDVLVTFDPFTGRRGPRLLPAFDNVDQAAAVRALDVVGGVPADVVLPGHGEPWTDGAMTAAAAAKAASA